MAQKQDHPVLAKPLYVFRLPEEVASTLELHPDLNAVTASLPLEDNAKKVANEELDQAFAGNVPKLKTCALCKLVFDTLPEQREHFKSDFHRYNLKQKLHGLTPVDEKEFDRRLEALEESLSGSDSSDSDSDAGSADEQTDRKGSSLDALLRSQADLTLVDQNPTETLSRKRKRGAGKPPVLWFSSSRLPSGTALGVYRALFPDELPGDARSLVHALQHKQVSPKPSKPPASDRDTDDDGGVPLPSQIQHKPIHGPHYFLCMIGGGHFAAMIVDLTPTVTRKGNIEDRSANVVAHKTFHRYTTRRKQGGSQSANDNSKGNAHSAGSSLRRYNEAALTTDIRNLIADWKPWLATAELLFIRASGTTNRRTLFGPYDGQVLSSRDPRIRGFPFATRRATQAELIRSFVELTRVKISSAEELNAARQAAEDANSARQEAAVPKSTASPKPSKPKPSKEEEEALLHTSQLQSLIRRSKAPGLVSYLTANNLDPNFAFHPADRPEHHHAPTPLHLSSSLNSGPCVTALLLRAGADPTIRTSEGKAAIELAGDRATRDAFRLARHELGDDKFDWDAAGVGSPLTKAEGEARARSEKDEAEAERAREADRRKAEVERLRREDKEKEDAGGEKRVGKGRALGNAAPQLSAEERRAEDARGMTPEMRMRLERERRARAAEARLGMR